MTTGKELRNYLQQVGLSQVDAAFVLGGINERTVRGWCGAPSARVKSVPEWVIPALAEAMGRKPHKSVDKFVIGKSITLNPALENDGIYLLHTEQPRFLCRIFSVHKYGDNPDETGAMFAQGNRLMKDFQFYDTELGGVKAVLDHACQILDDQHIAMY